MAQEVSQRSGGEGELVYGLALLQGGFGVLASLGTMTLMGSAVYLAMPLIKLAALLFFASKAAHGRRWAIITVIILQSVALAAYLLGALLGLLPALTFTFNLVGLITGLAMPATVIWLCARLLEAAGNARTVTDSGPPERISGVEPGPTVTSTGPTVAYTGPIVAPK